MREMKDSGIEWIGDIPKNWKITKLKYESSILYGYPLNSSYFSFDGFPVVRIRDITSGKIETYYTGIFPKEYVVTKGDILLGMDGDFNLREWQNDDAVLNQRCCSILGGIGVSKKFLYYALQGPLKIKNDITFSTTVKHLLSDGIANICFAMPNEDLQMIIVTFLDQKCSEIDAISEDIQNQITVLEDYKKSIITEAVTKGLNLDVEMKDSGVDWIGKVPKKWTVIRVGYLLNEIDERSATGKEQSLSVSQKLGIVPSNEILVPSAASTNKGQKIVKPGQLVLNKLKAHLGVCFVSNYMGLVSPDYAVYKSNGKVIPKILEYLFHTPQCIWEFKKYITGVGQGLSRLYTNDLFRIKLALPDIQEQDIIVSYLDGKCSEIDSIISDKKKQLEILAEYKKSLIYEYVTGKKEVPES